MNNLELIKSLSVIAGKLSSLHTLIEEIQQAYICEDAINDIYQIIEGFSFVMGNPITDCTHIWKPLQGTHERFCPLCGERDE